MLDQLRNLLEQGINKLAEAVDNPTAALDESVLSMRQGKTALLNHIGDSIGSVNFLEQEIEQMVAKIRETDSYIKHFVRKGEDAKATPLITRLLEYQTQLDNLKSRLETARGEVTLRKQQLVEYTKLVSKREEEIYQLQQTSENAAVLDLFTKVKTPFVVDGETIDFDNAKAKIERQIALAQSKAELFENQLPIFPPIIEENNAQTEMLTAYKSAESSGEPVLSEGTTNNKQEETKTLGRAPEEGLRPID